jgi:hypothetical protein
LTDTGSGKVQNSPDCAMIVVDQLTALADAAINIELRGFPRDGR